MITYLLLLLSILKIGKQEIVSPPAIYKCYCNNCKNSMVCETPYFCFTTVAVLPNSRKGVKVVRSCIPPEVESTTLALFCYYNLTDVNKFTKCCRSTNKLCNSKQNMPIERVLKKGNFLKS